MLRWAFYIAGALALIVLVVVVIGYLLPVAHVASRHATFAAPPERVFAVLTEVNEFPAWRPDVQNVEVLSPNRCDGASVEETATSRSRCRNASSRPGS